MVKDLASYVCKHNVSIPMSSEASFSEKYIMPAVRRILLENADKNIVYSLIDKPEDTGKKPDFMIGAKKRRTELYFFYMEVKRPDTTSRYQVEDDHTKLLKFMKESIDKQLRLGIEDPMSLGLLVEGFDCVLFLMKLLESGIYFPIAVKRFSLVGEVHELLNLPSIVEVFYYVK
ncbi:hypothetical protein BDF21DRAFT_361310, partial [Thamnidium elegans]